MILDRRAVLVILLLVLAGAVLAGRLLGLGESGPAAAVPVPLPASSVPASPAGEPPAPARLLVHVAGAVRRPGVYTLREGARVRDAVRVAGGPARRAALDLVNLAARLADGEQITVPRRGEAAPAAGGTAAVTDAIVHLSSATIEQLDALDGVGPTLAQRIIDWRETHGSYRTVDDLGEVPGIGPVRLEALRAHVAP